MRLFLVRHGAVVPPAPGAYYGGADVPLSELGQNEAQAAGDALAGVALDHVAASPLQRAFYGAEQVARHQGLAVQVYEGLREIDRGRWFGLTREAIETQFPGDMASHTNDLESWRGHGGESIGDLRNRVLAVRDELLEHWFGATVAVVSHMHPTRAILADAKGIGLSEWSALELPTASISMIEFKDRRHAKVAWVGYKPNGLGVERAFPQFF